MGIEIREGIFSWRTTIQLTAQEVEKAKRDPILSQVYPDVLEQIEIQSDGTGRVSGSFLSKNVNVIIDAYVEGGVFN